MSPRVFVSSVIDGFEAFRAAAREAIEAAGAEPVLVNEDYPSLPASSRNACLDAIESCDVFISIIGARGGWETPSGKLVIEEEYEHARVRKLPILLFLEETKRDHAAACFAQVVSDYIDGTFRRTFQSVDDLRLKVEGAVRKRLETQERRSMPKDTVDWFAQPYRVQGTPMLRFVLTPERAEELIDPVRLASVTFRNKVFAIGHADAIALLSYESAKKSGIARDDLVITQAPERGNAGAGEVVRLQLTGSGQMVIDADVTSAKTHDQRSLGLHSMVVSANDIEAAMIRCFAFSAGFYDEIDPYKRHLHFAFDVALSGLEFRTIERNPQPRTSYGMRTHGAAVIRAFEEPRVVSRADLRGPNAEIERAIELLIRRASE
jgi:hypothetical protein